MKKQKEKSRLTNKLSVVFVSSTYMRVNYELRQLVKATDIKNKEK